MSDYFYRRDSAPVWKPKLGERAEWVTGAGTNGCNWATWEHGAWLLSDGAELSTLQQSPLRECCFSGSPGCAAVRQISYS